MALSEIYKTASLFKKKGFILSNCKNAIFLSSLSFLL